MPLRKYHECNQNKSCWLTIVNNIWKYSWPCKIQKQCRVLYIQIDFMYAICVGIHEQNCVVLLFWNRALWPKQCECMEELFSISTWKEFVIQGWYKSVPCSMSEKCYMLSNLIVRVACELIHYFIHIQIVYTH